MPQAAPPQTPVPGLAGLIARHAQREVPRLTRLWRYYRNETRCIDGKAVGAQAEGLPLRLQPAEGRRREVVVENDIAWRVHTLVDYMFGKPIQISPLARDPERAKLIGRLLTAVLEVNGGPGLLQDAALLGTVYGHVDLLLRMRGGGPFNLADPADAASRFVIEPIDARRGIPALSSDDYRQLTGYILRAAVASDHAKPSLLDRVKSRLSGDAATPSQAVEYRVQAWSPQQVVDLVQLGFVRGLSPCGCIAQPAGPGPGAAGPARRRLRPADQQRLQPVRLGLSRLGTQRGRRLQRCAIQPGRGV